MGRPYGTAKLIYIANDGFRSLRLESKVSTTPREDKTDDTISGAHAPCNHWSRCPGPVCHYDGGPSSEIRSPDLGGLTRLDACINFGSHLCSGGRDGPGARRNHAPHHKTIPGAEPPRPPNALVFELFRTFVGNIGGTVPIILRSFAARAGLLGAFMSAVSVPAYSKLPARSEFLVSVSTLRCDHCRREIRVRVHRYWRMCFCSSACMTAYQQRLADETTMKIRRLDVDGSYE